MSDPAIPDPDPVSALDAMLQAVGTVRPDALRLLVSCQRCRNSLLYVVDTAQYDGDGGSFTRRLIAMPDHHSRSHGPLSPSDRDRPAIRGISS